VENTNNFDSMSGHGSRDEESDGAAERKRSDRGGFKVGGVVSAARVVVDLGSDKCVPLEESYSATHVSVSMMTSSRFDTSSSACLQSSENSRSDKDVYPKYLSVSG
jgi:hypothetical protein